MKAKDADNASIEQRIEELEKVNYLWHNHIWSLLQQNPFFIAHGYYVMWNGERWTREELDRWSSHDDEEPEPKESLQ